MTSTVVAVEPALAFARLPPANLSAAVSYPAFTLLTPYNNIVQTHTKTTTDTYIILYLAISNYNSIITPGCEREWLEWRAISHS